MKNAKKIVMGGVAALALVTASVMGTMAYFTNKTEQVNNTFTVGNVSIKLDEAPVDTNGKETTGDRRTSNTYKLYPGSEYDKDPTITVTGSEDSYLFVKVVNGISGVEKAASYVNAEGNQATGNIAEQMAAYGWHLVKDETDVYYYGNDSEMTPVEANEKKPVFKNFAISNDVNGKTLSDLVKTENSSAKTLITVKGYAIQSKNIANSGADNIKSAWKLVRDAEEGQSQQ